MDGNRAWTLVLKRRRFRAFGVYRLGFEAAFEALEVWAWDLWPGYALDLYDPAGELRMRVRRRASAESGAVQRRGIYRLIVVCRGVSIERFSGTYSETKARFEGWKEKVLAGWRLQIRDTGNRIIEAWDGAERT